MSACNAQCDRFCVIYQLALSFYTIILLKFTPLLIA